MSLIYCKIRPWKRDTSKHVLGFRFVILIANTYKDIIERLQAQFGGDISSGKRETSRGHKPIWSWRLVATQEQKLFLNAICPHSIIKHRQVALGLRYLETKVATGRRLSPEIWQERLAIFDELRGVNRRGIATLPKHHPPAEPSEGWKPKKRGYSDAELSEMMSHTRAGKKRQIASQAR